MLNADTLIKIFAFIQRKLILTVEFYRFQDYLSQTLVSDTSIDKNLFERFTIILKK